jgi:hypothetical protein
MTNETAKHQGYQTCLFIGYVSNVKYRHTAFYCFFRAFLLHQFDLKLSEFTP